VSARSAALTPDGRIIIAVGPDQELRLWDAKDGKRNIAVNGNLGRLDRTALSRDGKTLVSVGSEVLVWDVAALCRKLPPPAPVPVPNDLEPLWRDLASADAARAYAAVIALAGCPQVSLPFLQRKLAEQPPIEAQKIQRLLIELNDDQFEVRERATAELIKVGLVAEPAARKALASTSSEEVRTRLKKVLDYLGTAPIRAPQQLQLLRALEVFGRAGPTPEATRLLQKIQSAAPGSWLGQEAAAVVHRWDQGE
jgi:hypothetical protein